MSSTDRLNRLLDIAGAQIDGLAVTAVLFVNPDGDGTDGASWEQGYTSPEAALDAASTDADQLTLIMISPHATYYDINVTGDPTWTGNYILKGSHRNWAKIKNDHASATSLMKFTGKVAIENLNINLGTDNNGIILTHGGSVVDSCQFVGEDLTSPATALHIDGAVAKHGRIRNCEFDGDVTNMTAILLDGAAHNNIDNINTHECLKGVQIIGADSDGNSFSNLMLHGCAIALDLDAGNAQMFDNVRFHNCTINVDDEVGDHYWTNMFDNFAINILPDTFAGITVATHADPDTWTTVPVEILAGAGRTKPFRIVGVHIEADAAEKFRVKFTGDNGATYYDDILTEGAINEVQREPSPFPSGTEHIFNAGTTIKAISKSESGSNNANVWVEVQEI